MPAVDKEKEKARHKAWRLTHPNYTKTWLLAHPGYEKASYERNKTGHRAAALRWARANKDRVNENLREWHKNNPEKSKAIRTRNNKKIRSTAQGQLSVKMSSRICLSLQKKKNNQRWLELVDFTLKQLKRHIEKQFTEDMSWERYMKGEIHIDHKIPVSAFNYETPEDIDFKKCWSLKNLQPMWAKKNQSKGDKLVQPFQPSLLINV